MTEVRRNPGTGLLVTEMIQDWIEEVGLYPVRKRVFNASHLP